MFKLNDNFHLIYGIFSANVGIIKSQDEVAFIDSGWTQQSVQLILSYLDMVKGSASLRYIIQTHCDRDHIGGLGRIKKEFGAKIVVHEKEVEKMKNPPFPATVPQTGPRELQGSRTLHVYSKPRR